MASQQGKGKKQRTHKTSRGIHGATKHPLSEVQKALLGKGMVESIEHVPCKAPWRGAAESRNR